MRSLHFAVQLHPSRAEMGAAAAADIAAVIRLVLSRKKRCRMIFAAAPSQNEVLAALAADPDIDFSRIDAFHMDEYVGLPADARRASEISCAARCLRRCRSARFPILIALHRTHRPNARAMPPFCSSSRLILW